LRRRQERESTVFVRCSVRCFTVIYGAVRCRTVLSPSVGPCVVRFLFGIGSVRRVRSAPPLLPVDLQSPIYGPPPSGYHRTMAANR
jgi:hypothetical protein